MLATKNKYRDVEVDIKKLYLKEIKTNTEPKKQPKKTDTIKVYKLTEKEEREVFKLVNRDLLKKTGMERIELGDVYQVGTFVKEKKKTI